MKQGRHYRIDNSHGKRAYLNELRRVFAERERSIREEVRAKHHEHLSFLEQRGVDLGNIREASVRHVAVGTLAGLMALSPVSTASPAVLTAEPAPIQANATVASVSSAEDVGMKLAENLRGVMPPGSQNLSPEEEQKVSQILSKTFNVRALPELDGQRLNRTTGLIGAEQHLYRYPGDNIFDHASNSSDLAMFGRSGIAPGLGAYGYWTRSKSGLTPQMVQQERWYVVAQTFLAPGFKENPRAVANFFKYRKFLVVNPDTGQAVVGDLADAGPAEYTGKSFGGSPEVMDALGYGGGPRKGRVIFYFLDDPGNQIPLGPISGPVGGGK